MIVSSRLDNIKMSSSLSFRPLKRYLHNTPSSKPHSLTERQRQTEEALNGLFQLPASSSSSSSYAEMNHVPIVVNDDNYDLIKLTNRQVELTQQAQQITFALFRACLRSVRSMALPSLQTNHSSSTIHHLQESQSIDSRYRYYLEKIREGFYQDRDSLPLSKDINNCFQWRSHNLDRFVYNIQKGEEMRRWILQDYQIEDVWSQGMIHRMQRVKKFEQDAKEHLKNVYRYKGWDMTLERGDVGDQGVGLDQADEDKDIVDDLFWKENIEK